MREYDWIQLRSPAPPSWWQFHFLTSCPTSTEDLPSSPALRCPPAWPQIRPLPILLTYCRTPLEGICHHHLHLLLTCVTSTSSSQFPNLITDVPPTDLTFSCSNVESHQLSLFVTDAAPSMNPLSKSLGAFFSCHQTESDSTRPDRDFNTCHRGWLGVKLPNWTFYCILWLCLNLDTMESVSAVNQDVSTAI